MLSRIAESLFWIGRYLERADGTSRILDVYLQLLLEDPWMEESEACGSLLTILGNPHQSGTVITRQNVIDMLAVDAEQLIPTTRTQLPGPLANFVTELKSAVNLSPHEMALAIVKYVRSQIEYLPGSTGVNTTSLEAWEAKSGVCQDIAHITLAGLRFAGIPARYVSGYLHPDPDAKVGENVTAESHAWVEWYNSEWYGFDPTNLIEISDRHVLISRGRDYSDVPPIKGVYAGSGQSQLFVQVTIVRQQ